MLHPGDFCFTGDPVRVATLVGSCVAITMWHPRLRVGGMCHYMLPTREVPAGVQGPQPDEPNGRYADEAMLMFLDEIGRYATRPAEYQVAMAGGGDQFPGTAAGALTVPARNIAAGWTLLARHGFVVSVPHLGGYGPRRVALDLGTGAVTVRHLDSIVAGSPK